MAVFPRINKNQFVLIRALINTGQVLDEKFELKINEEQNIYSVFENINYVENYVSSLFAKRNDIEVWLNDFNSELVKNYLP